MSDLLEQLLQQAKELLDLIQDNKNKILKGSDLPKGVEENVELLEMKMDLFQIVTDKVISLSKYDPENIDESLEEKNQKIREQAQNLLQESKALREVVKLQLSNTRKKMQELKTPEGEKERKKRRKKFKRLGGQGGWQPL